MNRKKGFTLVELLATVVVLAIIITTAITVVLPTIERSRKNALVNEAREYIKAARTSNVIDYDGEIKYSCHDISSLTGEYVKNDKGGYTGTVVIDSTTAGQVTETISITNGKYYIVASGDDIKSSDVKDTMPGNFVSSCSNQQAASLDEGTLSYKLLMNSGGETMADNLSIIDERTANVNFNNIEEDANNSGLYKDSDDFGTTYYYRGNVSNNWVEFGDFYWRVVRINGDGSIRMIYSGTKSSSHTGAASGIKSTPFAITTQNTKYVNDISGLTTTQIQTKYANGRYANTYVGYMYNPEKAMYTYPAFNVSSSKTLSSFPTFSNIDNTKTYYLFKNFNPATDCDQTNGDNDTGTCTLKCRSLGDDCILTNWNDHATTSGNYSETGTGTTTKFFLYTGGFKYSCWGYATPVTKSNSDGTTSVYASCPVVIETIGTVKDQPTQLKSKYIGLFSLTNDIAITNVNNSNAKNELNTWYQNNILNKNDGASTPKSLESYLADGLFCNDRSNIVSGSQYPLNGTSAYLYASYTRVNTNKTPSLRCTNMNNDGFTLKSSGSSSTVTPSSSGNHLLEYPVGLLTMDELVYAGGKWNTANTNMYLFTGNNFYTMSPGYFYANYPLSYVGIYNSAGKITVYNTASNAYLRPVVNLSKDVLYSSGSGTEADPYKISI